MADLSQEDWVEQLAKDDDSFILDVRTPEEIEQGQIAGAHNINIYLGQEFMDALEQLDKTKKNIH